MKITRSELRQIIKEATRLDEAGIIDMLGGMLGDKVKDPQQLLSFLSPILPSSITEPLQKALDLYNKVNPDGKDMTIQDIEAVKSGLSGDKSPSGVNRETEEAYNNLDPMFKSLLDATFEKDPSLNKEKFLSDITSKIADMRAAGFDIK